ncbi:DegT/DnrJ/EryC1/StrS family aminotransferase [Candidatus Nanosyncoccus alces]|uniref:GDP-perosamine synthase n=1 Tax=Candidatus Nanosyncoccus alces TaxID=2171997 RepID=A0ABY0FLL7_9BACT|nr:DegT/DnrJ/EryC1/StrS family aminotransferase [Candidatus Nanosyncoccus alces]RYC74555.1 GDP-perosamine synthase [Candidatus Nanosyncoccus alces]
MRKHYFLGLAANYSRKRCLAHTFAIGRKKDRGALQRFLTQKYGGETILTKNGRSALALALKAYFDPGDAVIVNGFTCYAVYEAVKAAGLTPVWADISQEDLNFNTKTLEKVANEDVKGVIVQNSLGNPVDIVAVEKFAKKYNLVIIEDLAHCAGIKYAGGREVGTVGSAAVLSFGKDKAIDTISGGAVILRHPHKNKVEAPSKLPRISDNLRARFYPLLGAISRGLSYVHLSGIWMRCLVKIHWVEKSADNKLDLERKIAKFEAKLALRQLQNLKESSKHPLREFRLVRNREELLKKLAAAGYYFGGFWYERPVSPERYYKKVHFPEDKCPVAVEVAKKIINLPTCYSKKDLALACEIIAEYVEETK